MEAPKAAGAALLAVGIGVMLFTFYCAYGAFLQATYLKFELAGDPWQAFTEVLGPLIKSCIMVMFLGIMGWAGVVLTSRGVQLFRLPVPRAPTPTGAPPPTVVPAQPSAPPAYPTEEK